MHLLTFMEMRQPGETTCMHMACQAHAYVLTSDVMSVIMTGWRRDTRAHI
jgi:hypothetical protein